MESVFQSLEGDEIILIENGTSDHFLELCINYSDKYPAKKSEKKILYSVFPTPRNFAAGQFKNRTNLHRFRFLNNTSGCRS